MTKLLSSALILLLSISISSCSSTKEKLSDLNSKNKTQNISDLPQWIIDPSDQRGISAVGIASPSRGGIKFQIPQATLDAKANIASIIQSQVSRVTKNALREAKVNKIDDVEDVFSQATKEVVKNIPLSGVRRINMYQGKDGTLYIRMLLTNKDYSQYIKNSQNTYKKLLENANLSRKNIDKSQEAVKEIFNELESERAK
jgi:hypothetical protein